MAIRKRKPTGKSASGTTATALTDGPLILYVHGIGDKPPPEVLKREWDLALFGREMGERTRMAYWADILHGKAPTQTQRLRAGAAGSKTAAAGGKIDTGALLESAGVSANNEDAQALTEALLRTMGVASTGNVGGHNTKVLPLPAFLRRPMARAFLEALIKDTAAYFFRSGMRKRIQERLRAILPPVEGNKPVEDRQPMVVVAHSQGSIIALEVIAELAKHKATRLNIEHLVTIGSPLGLREVQDFLSCPLVVPEGVRRWHNFADPLDPVAFDKGIGNDFEGEIAIVDALVVNTEVRRLEGFNPHSSGGYLSHPKVRRVVHDSARVDIHARFLMARDVAASLAVNARHPVLIEILEPGYPAIDENQGTVRASEKKVGALDIDIGKRIENAATSIRTIVGDIATAEAGPAAGKIAITAARVDELRRFVAARLTPMELSEVAKQHSELRVYAIWKSATKQKLITRSARVIQADAAWASYAARGEGIRWAVLDTGVRRDHPHFKDHSNIVEVWDCTEQGTPTKIPNDDDPDGHGTHVAGIIAGEASEAVRKNANDAEAMPRGMAPKAELVIYKVFDRSGNCEDAWIIKALDHIARQNENNSEILIQGVNLSLGGPYDSTVYGCGFTPICAELRRLWRSGVLVVVAAGNEGQLEVSTPDGESDINTSMSIGDPANLEDCIAVGSVNADRPHLYGISAFSSRGPTSDGRLKPDVVAPGERISSCDSRYRSETLKDLYRRESGTSMAAPHVSGLLAAFLSVRREFCGRPDEVKALLLRTCIDLQRDRYHQGHGIPNLMRMLLEA